ncbi:oligosaccharide flippase family protein [Aliarcobacter cryaerophilus]|uniref:lipopolysaccharide biosynthesis protein n=1 Tax=Aliarcobacter cryaerophilus TaxID=28198 RepID=UPI003DA39CD2
MFKPKSEFTKNVVTLMMGTAVAQAIPIAISPILTRIYSPDDFGVFAIFIAIVSILGIISNGRYELAIMLPKKDEDAINIFALGFIVTCTVSIFMLILVFIFNDYFKSLFNNEDIGFWLYFVPIAVFFTGLYNILNYFNNRKKNYKDLRNAIIIKSIVLAIVQLGIGFFKNGSSGLISGQLLSNMFANIKLFKNILKDNLLISKISKVKIFALAKKYKDFPKFNLPSSLADTFTQQLPFLILPKMFDLSIAGYFSLSQKLIALPSSLIAKSFSQVYFQKISENKNKKIKNMPILLSTIKKLFLIALPFSICIFFYAPDIFKIIFGDKWIISGEIAKFLSLIFIITFIVSSISVTLIVYEKLKHLSYWQYLYLFSTLCFFYISIYLKLELEEFLFYFVIHEYILYAIYLYLIIITVKKSDILCEE